MYDYILIGQGIAGSLLYYFLKSRGKKVAIFDEPNPGSPSRIAGGMYTPLSGRGLQKSWISDRILPFAEKIYRSLEERSGKKFLFKKDIYKIFATEIEMQEWNSEAHASEISGCIDDNKPDRFYSEKFHSPFGSIVVNNSGFVDLKSVIAMISLEARNSNELIPEKFEFSKMILHENRITYDSIEAKKCIFCDGSKGIENPFFNWIPFSLNKGELLTIHSQDIPEDFIVKKGTLYILPLGKNKFKTGSTFDWSEFTDTPTEKAKDKIIANLKNTIQVDFSIEEHEAGIRPSIADRRPVIGLHPKSRNVGIFNGFGTKGASLSPYLADQFSKFLENDGALYADVNVERFYKRFKG